MNYLFLSVLTNLSWLMMSMTFAGIHVDIKPTDVDDGVPIIDVEVGDDHRCLFYGAFHPLSESDVCTLMGQ